MHDDVGDAEAAVEGDGRIRECGCRCRRLEVVVGVAVGVGGPTQCQPATGTISVLTAATAQAQLRSSALSQAAAFGVPSFLLGLVFRRRRFSGLPALFSFVLLAMGLSTLAGCGGHSSSSNPVTTSFTITASVTQAGKTVSRSVPATITVK